MIRYPPEREVARVWQRWLLNKDGLTTEDGEPIKIVYPGRLNDGRGADFRDAVILTSQGVLRGDVEIHVKSSSWEAHRHHRDTSYDRVVLHVVMWHDTGEATSLQNGKGIPILSLNKYTKAPVSRRIDLIGHPVPPKLPCLKAIRGAPAGSLTALLNMAGDERFFSKAARFQTGSARAEAGQCLYEGIMGALGYAKNKLPFLELARRLPLKNLESIARSQISDEECLARQQALLLGNAGLLPLQQQSRSQNPLFSSRWIDELEDLWAFYPHTEAMSGDDWQLFKVRPNNSPIYRLVAMSYLLLRYRQKGLLEGLGTLVNTVPLSQGSDELERGLMVATDDHLADCFDFVSRGSKRGVTLLGSERAADTIVNALLPFTFARGRLISQPELSRKALDLYRHYRRLAANSVERHMTVQFGLDSGQIKSARAQQGLIHIYNNFCARGRCNECSLSQLQAGNHVQV